MFILLSWPNCQRRDRQKSRQICGQDMSTMVTEHSVVRHQFSALGSHRLGGGFWTALDGLRSTIGTSASIKRESVPLAGRCDNTLWFADSIVANAIRPRGDYVICSRAGSFISRVTMTPGPTEQGLPEPIRRDFQGRQDGNTTLTPMDGL